MSFLTGSAPSVQETNQPTTTTSQQNILSFLANMIQGGGTEAGLAGGTQFPQQTVAPQTTGQTNVVGALENLQGYLNPAFSAPVTNTATTAETSGLGYQAPQVTAPQTSFSPTAPVVSPTAATNAFQQGVVAPTTANFLQTVIPSLKAQFGGSAGGAYSSGLPGSTSQAVSNLNTNLAGEGAQYALNTQTANQSALTANNSLLTNLALANLGSDTSTNALNVGSSLSGQGLINQDIGLSSAAAGLPYTGAGDVTSILNSLFPTISTPQGTAETGLTTQIGEVGSDVSQNEALDQILASLALTGTTQPNTVVQGGSSGILGPLLSAAGTLGASQLPGTTAAGATTGGSVIASLLGLSSDERLKTDIEPIGKTKVTKLPVYKFRYKAVDPRGVRRIGVMAQDVERKYPSAVGERDGFKTVNYGELALREAFPEAA